MQFENVQLFWLLGAVPALMLLARVRFARRQKFLTALVDRELEARVVPESALATRSMQRQALWAGLLALLLAAVVMRPQYGFTWKESSKKGVDIVLAVDVSESMLANDVKPSRLERARREIVDLIEEFRGDRVGLVAFAGVGFTETPLTLDYGTLLSFVSSLSPSLIPVKGTNIEQAVRESIRTLEKGTLAGDTDAQTLRSRAIILITDGEEFDGNLAEVSKLAEEKNVKLYIIGVGTIEGGPIPTPKGYKKDKNGKVVITKFSPAGLQELASKTGGVFVTSIGTDQDTKAIYADGIHQQLTSSEVNWARSKRYHEYFQVPLLLALLTLLLGPWGQLGRLSRRAKSGPAAAVPIRGAVAKAAAVLLYLLASSGDAAAQLEGQRAESAGAEGSKAYEEGNFEAALEKFDEGAARRREDARFLIGKGAAAYRLGRFDDANKAFTDANLAAKDPVGQAQALYNSGNSLVQLEQYQRAIDVYEKSLKLAPNDPETLENLAYARKLLEQKQQEKQDQQNQQQKQQQQQQDEQKQQQKKDQQSESEKQDQENKDSESKDQGSEGSENEQQNQDKQDQQNQDRQDQDRQDQDQENKDQQKSGQQDNEQQKPDQEKSDQDKQDQQQGKQDQQDEQEEKQSGNDSSGEKQDQNQSEDAKQNQGGQQPKADDQGKEGTGKKDQTEQKDDRPGDKQRDMQEAESGDGDKPQPQLSDEARMKLDSVEEKRNARFNYRFNKAMQQLKQSNQPLPDKDW